MTQRFLTPFLALLAMSACVAACTQLGTEDRATVSSAARDASIAKEQAARAAEDAHAARLDADKAAKDAQAASDKADRIFREGQNK